MMMMMISKFVDWKRMTNLPCCSCLPRSDKFHFSFLWQTTWDVVLLPTPETDKELTSGSLPLLCPP
jgi:hypothetical protein